MRIVVGLAGSSSPIYGIRTLEAKTVDDIINQTIGKILDQFRIEHALFRGRGNSPNV